MSGSKILLEKMKFKMFTKYRRPNPMMARMKDVLEKPSLIAATKRRITQEIHSKIEQNPT